MAGPVLTPQEVAQMTKEAASAAEAAATFQAQIAAQQARAAELAIVDGGFKKFFDYYHTDIIGHYDAERKLINGQYIAAPVTEADIVASGSLAGGRIQPSLPQTDVIRIPEFDGGPLVVDPANELQYIADQADAENVLVNGYGGSSPPATVETDTAITAGSTTMQLTDTTTFSIAPNSVFVIADGGDFAVIRILTFVMQVAPVPPPFVADCTIEVLVPPTGSIAPGANLEAFTGFSNPERTTKTAADPQLQPLMNYLVLQLQTKINQRITSLNAQLVELAANQDPDGVAAIATATSNVNSSKNILTNYLITTNISNSGLGTLSAERSQRGTDTTNRLAQIVAAYTGQSKNYFDERYNFANNRGSTSRGSLRLQKNAEQAASTSADFAATLGDQASAINSVLP